MGHLESPKLTSDLTMARDFDLGITGPPMSISMDFIASGLVEMVAGLAAAAVLAGYAWWAPVVLAGAWLATHWLLRESGVWRDRNTEEVRGGSRNADYAYRLAVEPPAAKELRLFGLADWIVDRFRVAAAATFRPAVAGHATARAAGAVERVAGAGCQHRGVFVDRDCGSRRGGCTRSRGDVRDGGLDDQHDRLWRVIVGA